MKKVTVNAIAKCIYARVDFQESGEGHLSPAYKEFFRMTKQQFYFLVGKVSSLIQKKEQPPPINLVRTTIQPDERLAVTLRFLSTGETFHSLVGVAKTRVAGKG